MINIYYYHFNREHFSTPVSAGSRSGKVQFGIQVGLHNSNSSRVSEGMHGMIVSYISRFTLYALSESKNLEYRKRLPLEYTVIQL